MPEVTRSQAMKPSHPVVAVLVGGLVAASLDLAYACIANGQYGYTPLWVFQSVASGWIGSAAFGSGVVGGALGVASHYAILLAAATLYLVVSAAAGLAIAGGDLWRAVRHPRLPVHELRGHSPLGLPVPALVSRAKTGRGICESCLLRGHSHCTRSASFHRDPRCLTS
jgi:hypothetical protein